MEAELNLDPDSNPESDPELITDPDPNLQIISDPDPDAQHWSRAVPICVKAPRREKLRHLACKSNLQLQVEFRRSERSARILALLLRSAKLPFKYSQNKREMCRHFLSCTVRIRV